MRPIHQIRMHNLELLVMECELRLGRSRGAVALLSKRSGVPAPLISQLRHNSTHSSGASRTLGDETARKLEAGMHKPVGWMDLDHLDAQTPAEADDMDRLRALTPTQLAAVRELMDQMILAGGGQPSGQPGRPVQKPKGH